jgi:hypothetical protein
VLDAPENAEPYSFGAADLRAEGLPVLPAVLIEGVTCAQDRINRDLRK